MPLRSLPPPPATNYTALITHMSAHATPVCLPCFLLQELRIGWGEHPAEQPEVPEVEMDHCSLYALDTLHIHATVSASTLGL